MSEADGRGSGATFATDDGSQSSRQPTPLSANLQLSTPPTEGSKPPSCLLAGVEGTVTVRLRTQLSYCAASTVGGDTADPSLPVLAPDLRSATGTAHQGKQAPCDRARIHIVNSAESSGGLECLAVDRIAQNKGQSCYRRCFGPAPLRSRPQRLARPWLSYLGGFISKMRFVEEESLFAPSTPPPLLRSALQMKILKGEDRVFGSVESLSPGSDLEVGVFAVFDGHNGPNTAHFCKNNLLQELLPRLPKEALPPESNAVEFQAHLLRIREAVAATFVALDEKSKLAGCRAGCTASLLLITGWLATVANVGDSDVVVQTTRGLREVSTTHRLNENDSEVARLEKAGRLVAQLSSTLHGPSLGGDPGIGPLRVWPCGLCVARAIGDEDVGVDVLPEPHIRQIRVPDSGARFALATDGVWDGIPKNKVGKLLQSFALQECAREVVRHSLLRTGLTDDTSLILVDVLPPQAVDFSRSMPASTSSLKRFMCMSSGSGPGEDLTVSSLLYTFASADMAGWDVKKETIRTGSEDLSSDDSSQHYVDPYCALNKQVASAPTVSLSPKGLKANDVSIRNIQNVS